MNLGQLKKNLGYHVDLQPIACRLSPIGEALPPIADDWLIQDISDDVIRISNIRTGHNLVLGKDHIHHFTSNPQKGERHGFLTLHVQIFLRGADCWVKPNLKPGEPLPPPKIEVNEKFVSINYPVETGIKSKLEAEGYKLQWCADRNLAEALDLKGWEKVIEPDPHGLLHTFRIKDRVSDLFLLKKRV